MRHRPWASRIGRATTAVRRHDARYKFRRLTRRPSATPRWTALRAPWTDGQVRTPQSWLMMDWPFAQQLKGGLVPQGDRHHQHGYRVHHPRERQPPYRPIQSRCTHLQQSRAGARKACKVPCKSMVCVEIFVLSVWPSSLPQPAIGSRRLSWRRARLASIGRRQWLWWWCAEPKVRDRRDRII